MKSTCLFDSVYSTFIPSFVGLIFSETMENYISPTKEE